jgi:NAD(P)-dependent dehydrogenase (short-subunit alcohol dehydrogenase family)
MEKRFVGKVAFVTGATTGIGQATAVRLASEGALVGVNQRQSDDPTETLRRIKDAGGEAFPVVADVRDSAQVVNAVEPGAIDTPMAASLLQDPQARKYYEDRIALHRVGKPEEMASVIAFLLSDDASYLTCTTVLTDAGFIVNAEL